MKPAWHYPCKWGIISMWWCVHTMDKLNWWTGRNQDLLRGASSEHKFSFLYTIYGTNVIIEDGNAEHVAHVLSKIGLIKKKYWHLWLLLISTNAANDRLHFLRAQHFWVTFNLSSMREANNISNLIKFHTRSPGSGSNFGTEPLSQIFFFVGGGKLNHAMQNLEICVCSRQISTSFIIQMSMFCTAIVKENS